jgi:hypothetical protein
MQVLVDAREKLEIPWENPNLQLAATDAMLFHSGNGLDVETFRRYTPTIHRLWQDRAIRKAYDRRREFQIVSIFFIQFLKPRPTFFVLSLFYRLKRKFLTVWKREILTVRKGKF